MAFEHKDVSKDPGALADLRALGYRSVPVTVVGDQVVLGYNPRAITKLLGLDEKQEQDDRDVAWFRRKLERFLDAAVHATEQIPPPLLDWVPPGRDRGLREFIYHMLNQNRICLRSAAGAEFTQAALAAQVEEALAFKSPEDLGRLGREAMTEVRQWAEASGPDELRKPVQTYFGEISVGELLDVSALGHLVHHLRQLYVMLEQQGIQLHDRVEKDELEGIAVPTEVW